MSARFATETLTLTSTAGGYPGDSKLANAEKSSQVHMCEQRQQAGLSTVAKFGCMELLAWWRVSEASLELTAFVTCTAPAIDLIQVPLVITNTAVFASFSSVL